MLVEFARARGLLEAISRGGAELAEWAHARRRASQRIKLCVLGTSARASLFRSPAAARRNSADPIYSQGIIMTPFHGLIVLVPLSNCTSRSRSCVFAIPVRLMS